MVRARAWETSLASNSTVSEDARAFDFLAGSGLAVPGATVQRLIGRIDVRFTPSFTLGFTGLNLAFITGPEPDPATFTFSGGRDYLWFGRLVGQGTVANEPAVVDTSTIGAVPLFDVAGQRILLTGESLWAVGVISNADTLQPIRWTWSVRVLVLGPDV